MDLSGPSSTSGRTASGPTISGRTASGSTASCPTASGPTASGPTASGPTATGPTASGRKQDESASLYLDSVLSNMVFRIELTAFLHKVYDQLRLFSASDRLHLAPSGNYPTPETLHNFQELADTCRVNQEELIVINCLLRKRTTTPARPEYERLISCPFWSYNTTAGNPSLKSFVESIPLCGLSTGQDIAMLELSTDPRCPYIPYSGITLPSDIVIMFHNIFHKSGIFYSIIKVTPIETEAIVPSKSQQPKYILLLKRGLYSYEDIESGRVPITGEYKPITVYHVSILKYPMRMKHTLRINGARSEIQTLIGCRLMRQISPDSLAIFNLHSLVKICSLLVSDAYIVDKSDAVVPSVNLDPNDILDFQYVQEDYEDSFDPRGMVISI